jgi:CRP/FNR family transcriptional regulator
MKKNLDVIAAVPLFNGLPPDQLEAIKNIAIEKKISKGEMVVSEGDEGKGFFVIAEGRIKVFKVSAEGKEQILHIFEPGQPFGEVPVFAGQKFPANAQAIDKAKLWFFPRAAIVNLITANPSLALNMLSEMSRKLRLFAMQIENLSLKEMPERLASYLIHLADKISKGQLASILGTIPETLSRIFAKLSATNLIRVEGKKITLRDREGLENLAEYGKDAE